MALTNGSLRNLTNYNSTASLGSWFRKRRSLLIAKQIISCSKKSSRTRVLDIGGRRSYWNIFSEDFLDEYNVEITLVNDSVELEINQPEHNQGNFIHSVGDGCDMNKCDSMSYDFVHCNSVIEHVGNWERMTMLSKEIRRLAPSYYVQTPNFWFPIEPHFLTPIFHWLPEHVRIWLIQRMSLGHMSKQSSISEAVQVIESVRLLNADMFFSLFEDANHKREWFMGLPKSLIAFK
jgi:Methyltransferase domain